MEIAKRLLGKTGVHVTAFGLGGEGVLRTHGRDREAGALIRRALDLGVTYFESARAYAGSEGYLGAALGADRARVFLATKSHNRGAADARAHLEQSLALLRTDWVDLWMVHDVRTAEDLEAISGPGGALETFVRAKEKGDARFIGLSGHQDPEVLRQALDLADFDCVLLPVNPCEGRAGGFVSVVVPEARARGMGVIAMKTLCRGMVRRVPGAPDMGPFLRYALSTEGVSLTSVGCDDPSQVEANVAAVAASTSLTAVEHEALEQLLFPYCRDLLYYRPASG